MKLGKTIRLGISDVKNVVSHQFEEGVGFLKGLSISVVVFLNLEKIKSLTLYSCVFY